MLTAGEAKLISRCNAPSRSVVSDTDGDILKISGSVGEAASEGKYSTLTFFKPFELSGDRVSALLCYLRDKGYRCEVEEICMGRPMPVSIVFRVEWD